MRILLVFIDGIGIGEDNPATNPFSIAKMPTLTALTNGKRWVSGIGRQKSDRATFYPVDPRMGIAGRPQSGSNHATIITGRSIPQILGEHYGPKPNAKTREILAERSLFSELRDAGKSADLLTAYPPHLLHNINRGKTLPSGFMQAAINSGLSLHDVEDLRDGRALSADWTGHGWGRQLNIDDVQVMSPEDGGRHMVRLAQQHDFAMHSHVFTDYVGHRGDVNDGVRLLELIDRVMAGALEAWDDEAGLIVLTSDHGNMEVTGDRHHTENDVPFLVVGAGRDTFVEDIRTLADIAPAIRRVIL